MNEEKPFILNLENFAERIKKARKSQKMNQTQLAQKAGLTPTTISSYEKGGKSPSLENAVKLAHALGASLDWLCGIESTPIERDKNTLTFKLHELADLASLQCCLIEQSEYSGVQAAGFYFSAPQIIDFVDTLKALQTLSQSGISKDVFQNMVKLAIDGFAEKYKNYTVNENGVIDGLPDDLPF